MIIPLPIPTTMLIDAAGIVRWIDRSADYLHRSDPARVMAQIEALVAQPSPARRAAEAG